jgi:teichuronic acid biosynthesis glycosyltransferase TuaH
MSTDAPYLVWMANKLWENPGIDRRMTREMERHARILWVDPPVSLATSAQRRCGAARTIQPVLSVMNDNVIRLTPTALPGMSRLGIRTTTGPLIRAQIRWALHRTGIEPFAVVTTNLVDVLGRWGSGVVNALHGTDDYVAGAELMRVSANRIRAQERIAVARADVVTALSPILAERWSALRGAPVPLIPNGCTPVKASARPLSPAIRDLPRPVVGLVGRLNARVNMDLVEAVVDAGFSLLLVGPHDPRWEPRRFSALIARPGVHYVGRVPEEEAPAYIAATDIGITPYLDTPFNRASFPLKTLDYLSAGRPAVCTTLPAARWLLDDLTHSEQEIPPDRILVLADDCAGFIKAVRRIVGDPDEPYCGLTTRESALAERCRAFAARHTWSRRADALAMAIGLTTSGGSLAASAADEKAQDRGPTATRGRSGSPGRLSPDPSGAALRGRRLA